MRRRPPNTGGGYNNQHKRPQRYQQNGGGEHRPQHNHSRPRRNYGQAQQKYLEQARQALAGGDRVMAEYFFQHAEHCYRMMVEEGQNQPRPNYTPPPQANGNGEASAEDGNGAFAPDAMPAHAAALPAFITATFDASKPVDPAAVQNWEDRDA